MIPAGTFGKGRNHLTGSWGRARSTTDDVILEQSLFLPLLSLSVFFVRGWFCSIFCLCLAGGRGAGGDDETEREGAAAGRRARAGACVGGGSSIGDGEGRVQSGNFKLPRGILTRYSCPDHRAHPFLKKFPYEGKFPIHALLPLLASICFACVLSNEEGPVGWSPADGF